MSTAREASGLEGNCLRKKVMKGARLHTGEDAGVPLPISLKAPSPTVEKCGVEMEMSSRKKVGILKPAFTEGNFFKKQGVPIILLKSMTRWTGLLWAHV